MSPPVARVPLNAVFDTRTFAVVELDQAVYVHANDPAVLTLLADAFTDAARMLSDRLDRDAARHLNAHTAVPA